MLGPFVQSCLAQDDDDEEAKNQKHTVMVFNEDVGAEGSAGLRVFFEEAAKPRFRQSRGSKHQRCLQIRSVATFSVLISQDLALNPQT